LVLIKNYKETAFINSTICILLQLGCEISESCSLSGFIYLVIGDSVKKWYGWIGKRC